MEIYSNPNLEEKLGAAVSCGGHFFALAWKEALPSKVYIKEGDASRALNLSTSGYRIHEPVLYSRTGAAPLALPAIPNDHPADLQLVSLNEEMRIALGEQRGEDFSLPFHYLESAAIALLKDGNVYMPVGIYEPGARKIRPMRDFDRLKSLVQQSDQQSERVSLSPASSDEQFYVLENEYQQLVFSTRGGSLAEINLPMKSSKYPNSIVKEIDIDRQILNKLPSKRPISAPSLLFTRDNVLNQEGAFGGYYPLFRRSILKSDGSVKTEVSPQYYALNIVGDDPLIANTNYQMTRFEPNLIQFEVYVRTKEDR